MEHGNKLSESFKSKLNDIKENSVINYFSQPVITMFGNKEFFAEGKISVEKYKDTEIVLNINSLTVRIVGRGLGLCFYSRKTVKAYGLITELSFDECEGI